MSPAADGTPRLPWTRVALGGAIAVLVGGVVVAVIGRAAGFDELEATIRAGQPEWLTVCAAGQFLVFAGYAGAYRGSVRFEGGPTIGTGLSLRVVMASFALTQLVAAGGAAALAVTYWAFRRLGFRSREAGVRLIGLNTLVYLVFGLTGLAAAIVALLTAEAPLAMTLPWIVVVPVLLVAARWFTDARRVLRWTEASTGPFRRALGLGVGGAWWVRRVLGARQALPTVLWAACYWVGDIASLWGALRAFGGDPDLVAFVLVYTTGYVAQMTPIPFVATGGVDAATTFALTAIGVPLEQALLAVVAHRLFAFWLPLAPGLVLAALLPRTGRLLERAAAAK
jgi:uncharacterized membrane protein YbhN (UPF0104 family)